MSRSPGYWKQYAVDCVQIGCYVALYRAMDTDEENGSVIFQHFQYHRDVNNEIQPDALQ